MIFQISKIKSEGIAMNEHWKMHTQAVLSISMFLILKMTTGTTLANEPVAEPVAEPTSVSSC